MSRAFDSRADHKELVAAKTADGIAFPGGATKTIGSGDQKAVASRVTQPVVHGFEIIEVDVDDGAALSGRLRRSGHRLDKFERRLSIQT